MRADVGILGDVGRVLEDLVRLWRATAKADKKALYPWWEQIARWRARDSLAYRPNDDVIMPQYAVQRLYALTKDMDTYITTEVGQHQMWAAQHYHFEKPNRWMTSGGLGTMGYGLPAALGVQIAHPDSLVIDIAGDASVQMTMQEMSTAVQYEAPIKIFILNNQYMGMVRQWQQLLHGNRLSHSYTEAMPDFVKLARGLWRPRHPLRQAGRARRRDQGDDRGEEAGDLRLPRRRTRQLLPDDPVGQGAQRDAAARRGDRRSGGQRHRRQGQGAGVSRRTRFETARANALCLTASYLDRMSR